MVPKELRMDQGHFGRELHKWRINGDFKPLPSINVCQTVTSGPSGEKQTTHAIFRGRTDIRRQLGERFWSNIKGPLLQHGDELRAGDNVQLKFTEEYNKLIVLLGKKSLNLDEATFMRLYELQTQKKKSQVQLPKSSSHL
jgi:hypothetical protein